MSNDVELTGAEDLFVEILQEAIGVEAVASLAQQYPTQDIYSTIRYIDFALMGRSAKYAFEIDGEYWHRPDSPHVSTLKFRDDLLRQNSLIHAGWRIFRWSDGQLAEEREQVKDQLRLFLQNDLTGHSFDGYLPQQQGEEFSLQEHQSDALEYLDNLRAEGKSIALLNHATGTGKTITALFDAKKLNRRVLYLVHRGNLVSQTLEKVREHWPEVSSEAYRGGKEKPDVFCVLATVQAVHKNLNLFGQDEFGYLILDEAHHVPSDTFKQTISYFRPAFTLGLTATPERMDGCSLLEIFSEFAPRLGLKDAIEKGLLCPIRCLRVRTNVDLNRIRFNGSDYRASELEERISVPERNRLIVETYTGHVNGKPGVTFCVNVTHAEEMAQLYSKMGVSAASVSGRMNRKQQDAILARYERGELQMLCACDLLNEGWDAPQTEVLLMARPTLSRVLYVQQLGRGTRKHLGKECLWVFDFIDNTNRYAQSLNTHRIFEKKTYRPGELVAGTSEQQAQESEQMQNGQTPVALLHLGLRMSGLEEVDIFTWQTLRAQMVSASQLGVEFGLGHGTVERWIETGKLVPDHTVEVGERDYHYFDKARVEAIRQALGLKKRTPETRRADFFEFIEEMDMASSYKPVFLLALMDSADDNGRAGVKTIATKFAGFYKQRLAHGLPVEVARNRMARVEELSADEIAGLILTMPFEKFERRQFLKHEKDVAFIGFDRALWRALTPEDLDAVRYKAQQAVQTYYERFA